MTSRVVELYGRYDSYIRKVYDHPVYKSYEVDARFYKPPFYETRDFTIVRMIPNTLPYIQGNFSLPFTN